VFQIANQFESFDIKTSHKVVKLYSHRDQGGVHNF